MTHLNRRKMRNFYFFVQFYFRYVFFSQVNRFEWNVNTTFIYMKYLYEFLDKTLGICEVKWKIYLSAHKFTSVDPNNLLCYFLSLAAYTTDCTTITEPCKAIKLST